MHIQLKLVFVAGVHQVLEYKMLAKKVVTGPEVLALDYPPERDGNAKQGFFQKQSSPSGFFDPHTSFKDLEYEQSARALAQYIDKLVTEPGPKAYEEIVVIGSPKLVGHFRKQESKAAKPYIRTVVKNLLDHRGLAHIKEALPAVVSAS